MTINELKTICINDSIPILRDKTLEYIINIIKENKIKSILEIGTAYGYSSFAFNQIDCVNEILSIEKNKDNYLKAKNFLAGNKKINLVNDDCFDFVPNKKYDLILIDSSLFDEKLEEIIKKYNVNTKIIEMGEEKMEKQRDYISDIIYKPISKESMDIIVLNYLSGKDVK